MQLTPRRTRYHDTVAIIANSVYYLLNRITGASRGNKMLRFDGMNGMETFVEEQG
jgi:hypothetical protein